MTKPEAHDILRFTHDTQKNIKRTKEHVPDVRASKRFGGLYARGTVYRISAHVCDIINRLKNH